MPADRLQEIRARLDLAQHYKPGNVGTLDAQLRARFEEDIAWLLDEVDAAHERIAILRAEVTDLEHADH